MADDKKEVELKPGEKKELVIPLAVDDSNKGDVKAKINLEVKINKGDNKERNNLSKISKAGENIDSETGGQKDEGTEEPKDKGTKGQDADGQEDEQDGLSERGEMNKRPEMRNKEKQDGQDQEAEKQEEGENKQQGTNEQADEEADKRKNGESKEQDEEKEDSKEPKKSKDEKPGKPELGPQGQLNADKNASRKKQEQESKDGTKDGDKKEKFKTIQEWNKFKKQARKVNRRDKAKGVKKEATNKAIKLLSFEFYRQCWFHYFSSWTFTYFGLLFLFVLKYVKFEKNIIAFVSLSDPSVREKVVKGEDKTSILAIMAFISATFIEALIILFILVMLYILYKLFTDPLWVAGKAIEIVWESVKKSLNIE